MRIGWILSENARWVAIAVAAIIGGIVLFLERPKDPGASTVPSVSSKPTRTELLESQIAAYLESPTSRAQLRLEAALRQDPALALTTLERAIQAADPAKRGALVGLMARALGVRSLPLLGQLAGQHEDLRRPIIAHMAQVRGEDAVDALLALYGEDGFDAVHKLIRDSCLALRIDEK